jgi:hypothetical protein
LQQKLNNEKQRQYVQVSKVDSSENAKKRSRGAIQRAKKKQKGGENGSSAGGQQLQQKFTRQKQVSEDPEPPVSRKKAKTSNEAPTKPLQANAVVSENPTGQQDRSKKRWFE